MSDEDRRKEIDPRKDIELAKALALVHNTVDRQYVSAIGRLPVFLPSFKIVDESREDEKEIDQTTDYREIGENAELFELERFVYDEDEKIQDKLVSAYQAVASYKNAKLFMLIRSNEKEQKIYLGVANEDSSEAMLLSEQIKALEKNLTGNFPGSRFKKFKNIPALTQEERGISAYRQKQDLLRDVFCGEKNIASISGIPSMKSEEREENKQFTQGIEKFMDSILGEKVDVLILAEPVLANELADIKSGYQELFSSLSPFGKSVINVTKTNGENVTDTVTKGITDTTNESVAKTHTHTLMQGINSTDAVGGHAGGRIAKVVDLGADYHHAWGKHKDTSESDGETITEGISKSLNEQNSTANGLSSSYSDGMQLEYENKSIKIILEKIDRQLERIKTCEDYGMYDCGVYVISDDYSAVVSASASFKSIMRGKESSAEASYINTWQWQKDEAVVNNILAYLSTFNHPVFCLRKDSNEKEMLLPVSPSTIISGKELSIQMGMPRKSISGIPVLKTARFGRKVLYVDRSLKSDQELLLGNIYHMNNSETTEVSLNKDSLTAHTFITGSTGTGKSNTVYQILDKLQKQGCRYMVIEPAKGEYKDVFGGYEDVAVYGTNPVKFGELLQINPFSFPEEVHVLEHIDRLVEILNACWPMYAAMPAVMKDAIEKAYEKHGWNLRTSTYVKREFPNFGDLLDELQNVLKGSEFSGDTKADYEGALVTRVKSMTNGINGLVLCPESELTDEELFDNNVIVDISRVGSVETKSLYMGILVMKLQEHRMQQASSKRISNQNLRHVTVLEEAHNLLRKTSVAQSQEGANLQGKSVEMITNAIAEMRTYGEGFIIADQAPGMLDEAVIRNTNTKIILRLPDGDDRELVGKAVALSDNQIQEIAKLPQGVAVVYQNDWVEAVLCQFEKFPEEKQKAYAFVADSSKKGGEDKVSRNFFELFFERKRISDFEALECDAMKKWVNGLDVNPYTKRHLYDCLEGKKLAEDVQRNVMYNLFKGKSIAKKLETTFDEAAAIDAAEKMIYAKFDLQDHELSRIICRYVVDCICRQLEEGNLADRFKDYDWGNIR